MSRQGRALRKERRDRQRILDHLLVGAEPLVSGWVPDPSGGHDLRFIRNGVRTELVADSGDDVATDSSGAGTWINGRAAWSDWYEPETTPRAAATNPDWLMPGTYVYRCRSKSTGFGAKPAFYSPVWVAGRKIYEVQAEARTVTHIQSGAAFSWRWGIFGATTLSRDGSAVGTIKPRARGYSLRDANRQRLARIKGGRPGSSILNSVRSLDGAPIASGYWRRNPSDVGYYDGTVVLTVIAALTVPLATLVLAWWLNLPQVAHVKVQSG